MNINRAVVLLADDAGTGTGLLCSNAFMVTVVLDRLMSGKHPRTDTHRARAFSRITKESR